jgi:hypothetical protein
VLFYKRIDLGGHTPGKAGEFKQKQPDHLISSSSSQFSREPTAGLPSIGKFIEVLHINDRALLKELYGRLAEQH